METENTQTSDETDKSIRRVYYSKTGNSTPYKTYLDAKTIDPSITFSDVKEWFKKNIERTKQVGGAKHSYVAPHAYFEYQADNFYITDRQYQNQDYIYGLSMIDVFSKYAAVIPLKERDAENIMAAIFKAFKIIGKQPEILYTDNENEEMGSRGIWTSKHSTHNSN